jgi:hypothetical protein
MATEPVSTSPNYDPSLTYTAPVGRLPVLGKFRAEIDRLRAAAANDLNTVINRDLAQIDNHAKVTAEIAALGTTTADNTRKIDSDIEYQDGRLINETSKNTAEIIALGVQSDNDTTKTNNDTTRTNNDTSRTVGELAALASKTAAEVSLLGQKKESERAQTEDIINNGNVVGLIGKQKDLFAKQAAGFDRDAEQKLAKIMVDTWSVRQSTNGVANAADAGINDAVIKTVIDKAKAGISVA